MKANQRERFVERLYIRVTKKEKEQIRQLAERAGIVSIKTLVFQSLQRTPVSDIRYRKQFVSELQKLTYEMNQIGNNINQCVHAIHLMNINKAVSEELLKDLIATLKQYQAKREALKTLFEKILYP